MRPFESFDARRRVVAAVSGGADSMALAWLLSRWGEPAAAIVDHGLRADSATEAVGVAERLEAIGVPATIIPAHLARGSAAAERARVARYRLLLDHCRALGRPDLVLAHHADDQAETVALREAGGSGPAGRAGMAPLDIRPEARLLRPLLPIAPARLRATLRQAGIDWVEDPTNADPRTGRGALRSRMTEADRATSRRRGEVAALCRAAREAAVAAQLRTAEIRPEGFAVVRGPIGADALSALVWSLSGRRYPPPRPMLAAGLATRTMHGVVIRPAGRLGSGTLLAREPAAIGRPIPAESGTVWDGRFRIAGLVPSGLTIGALGAEAKAFRDRSELPSMVLAGLPALRCGEVIWAVPHLGFPDPATCLSVALMFWPTRPVVPTRLAADRVNPSAAGGV